MTLLLVGSYKKFDTNEYIELLANAYMRQGVNVLFEEQNFLFSNFLPDVIHIQWPESLYRWKKLITMDARGLEIVAKKLQWYTDNSVKIVYTVHNLEPHDDAEDFDYKIYSLLLDYANIVVHHGKNSIELLKQKYPETINSKHIIAPHGSYSIQKQPARNVARKKYALPEDAIICTNFGLQRSYKGRDFNVEVFKDLKDKNICYFAVGALVGNTKSFEISQKELCNRQLYEKVPYREIPYIMAATDVFFLGHSSGLNSGLITLAISYSKPIVFPNIGNFEEQAMGWEYYEMYDSQDIKSAKAAMKRIFTKIGSQKRSVRVDNQSWLLKNSWDRHVTTILNELSDV